MQPRLPPRPGIFPNIAAPIVHVAEGRRVPSPAFALEGKLVDSGIVHVCNIGSSHERRRLGPRHGIGYRRLGAALGEE